MKIAIKRKYIGGISTGITCFLGYYYSQTFISWLVHQKLINLLLPSLFLFSLIYTTIYWVNLKRTETTSKEIGNEVANRVPDKAENVAEHLWKKSYEDFYTLNIQKGTLKLTTNWVEQEQFEKTYK